MTGSNPNLKNQPFRKRLGYAVSGVKVALRTQASFRFQTVCAVGAMALLVAIRPAPVWWALVILTVAAVLSLELVNTALEFVVDRLHPEVHPLIAQAKDCAAGAVLVMSVASLAVALAMVFSVFFTKP